MNESSALLRRFEDSYSTVVVEDMLQGVNEWQNIQDVVRLTFKALSDVVRNQGIALKEAERHLRVLRTDFASKPWTSDLRSVGQEAERRISEELGRKLWQGDLERLVQMELARKPWLADLRSLAEDCDQRVTKEELAVQLQEKVGFEELTVQLQEKVGFEELEECLASKANLEDITNLAEAGVHLRDVEAEVQQLSFALKEMERPASSQSPADLSTLLEDKVSRQELQEAVDHFPELMADMLSRKADSSELQRILAALETKADHETLDALVEKMQTDLAVSRPEAVEEQRQTLVEELQLAKGESEHYMADLEGRVNQSLQQFAARLEDLQIDLQRNAYRKGELDELKSTITRKVDLVLLNETLAKTQLDTGDTVSAFRSQLLQQQKQFEDIISEKLAQVDQASTSSTREMDRLRSLIQTTLEDRRRDAEDQGRLTKAATASAKTELRADLAALAEQVERLQQFVDETIGAKASRSEVVDEIGRLSQAINAKADVAEVQRALGSSQKDAAQHFVETKDEFKAKISKLEADLLKLINTRPTYRDLDDNLKAKAEEIAVAKALGQKANIGELTALAEEVDKVYRLLEDCVRQKQFQTSTTRMSEVLEDFGKELLLRASIKDVCTLLDLKASTSHLDIEDVNQALQEVHSELDGKVAVADFVDQSQEQQLLVRQISAEVCVGRWLWKSGEVRGNYAVPWELQSGNTCPENFLWEKNATALLITAPGLYEISACFYANRRPTLQLIINGDVIISVKDHPEYFPNRHVVYHSSRSQGAITGLSLHEFLSLPARSRLTLTYAGERGGEGFLALRKL